MAEGASQSRSIMACRRAKAPNWLTLEVACKGFGEINSAGLSSSAGNEGVGEHVRTRFHLGKAAGEIADQ